MAEEINSTVLVVEDEADMLELFRLRLEANGYSVRTASDGREGLESALNEPPDLVLLDLMLPGMDGLNVCRRLKSDEGFACRPVLMISARAEEDYMKSGISSSADAYMTKPFAWDKLHAKIRELLETPRERKGGAAGKTKAILIVDDEKDFMDALSIRLENFGWNVFRAGSPEEGVLKARELTPDLIIMDVMFPCEMDGYEASRKIKSDGSLSGTPIIMLTVRAMQEDIERGISAGADCYMTKPLDNEKFLEKISMFLGEPCCS